MAQAVRGGKPDIDSLPRGSSSARKTWCKPPGWGWFSPAATNRYIYILEELSVLAGSACAR